MERPMKILIVVSEVSVAFSIHLKLSASCCETIGFVAFGEDAINLAAANHPDIILIGFHLNGELDGHETARYIREILKIPTIYLISSSEEKDFFARDGQEGINFILTSFNMKEMEDAIRMACLSTNPNNQNKQVFLPTDQKYFKLDDAIFIKHYEKMVKIPVKEILFIKADRNYCCIQTFEKKTLVVITLRELEQKLPPRHFLRIHRSFIINLSQIVEIGSGYVVVGKMTVPLSKKLKQLLLNHLRAI